MQAMGVFLALILVSPGPVLGADGRGWQGWAFEVREEGMVGWAGSWTPGACEVRRREALEEKLDASIGECHLVMLTDEPAGIAVWAVMLADAGFVAASSPAICEEDDTPSSSIRPVSLVTPACQRVWLLVPA